MPAGCNPCTYHIHRLCSLFFLVHRCVRSHLDRGSLSLVSGPVLSCPVRPDSSRTQPCAAPPISCANAKSKREPPSPRGALAAMFFAILTLARSCPCSARVIYTWTGRSKLPRPSRAWSGACASPPPSTKGKEKKQCTVLPLSPMCVRKYHRGKLGRRAVSGAAQQHQLEPYARQDRAPPLPPPTCPVGRALSGECAARFLHWGARRCAGRPSVVWKPPTGGRGAP